MTMCIPFDFPPIKNVVHENLSPLRTSVIGNCCCRFRIRQARFQIRQELSPPIIFLLHILHFLSSVQLSSFHGWVAFLLYGGVSSFSSLWSLHFHILSGSIIISNQLQETMHRTYSLRSNRAPTASDLQNPIPVPPSSTKSPRFFGPGGLANSFRRSTAGSFGPELSRKLAQLVKMEKNVMRAIEVCSRERRDAARQLSLWGADNEDDVSDITDKLGVLIYEIGELEDQFIDRYDQYRITIKSIRDIEGSVQPSRDRKHKITDQIAYLKYKDPQSPKISILEQELVRAEAESLVAEAQLSNITREKLKASFSYQFDSIREYAEKVALIAGYGKALLELLDDSPVTPGETRPSYDGYEASKQIIIDCENALATWTFETAAVKPTLSFKVGDYEDELADDVDNLHVEDEEWNEEHQQAVGA